MPFIFRINNGTLYYADQNLLLPSFSGIQLGSVQVSGVAMTSGTYPTFGSSNVNGATGTATTNGIIYNVYTFTTISTTSIYTVSYNCTSSTICYVLAVGGGGSGANNDGGGGGGGGVVIMPVSLPASPSGSTIIVSVGNGAVGGAVYNNSTGVNGTQTTITFTAATSSNITAYGGGGAGSVANGTNYSGKTGGSGGGGSGGGGGNTISINQGTGNNSNNNFANAGGLGDGTSYWSGGGGGAGQAGTSGVPKTSSKGGDGIQCFLPGINNFSSSGTPYGSYYWGGGGGGGNSNGGSSNYANGGLGGGGGGGNGNTTTNAGGGSALNTGGTGLASNGGGGNGGANTGGGGGGNWNTATGSGGSGIVVIAFLSSTTSSALLTNYNFASQVITANTSSAVIPTGWNVSGSGAYYISNGTGGNGFNTCPYGQFFYTSTTTQVVLSQTIGLSAKTYTLSFCAAVLSSFSGSFTITIGSNNYTSTLTNSNIYWNNYSWNFTIPTAGSYNVIFTFNCPVGITQILIY